MSAITTGDRVVVNDSTWHRHGDTGTVIKVGTDRHRTLRVQMDSNPLDVVKGASIYFTKEA